MQKSPLSLPTFLAVRGLHCTPVVSVCSRWFVLRARFIVGLLGKAVAPLVGRGFGVFLRRLVGLCFLPFPYPAAVCGVSVEVVHVGHAFVVA